MNQQDPVLYSGYQRIDGMERANPHPIPGGGKVQSIFFHEGKLLAIRNDANGNAVSWIQSTEGWTEIKP